MKIANKKTTRMFKLLVGIMVFVLLSSCSTFSGNAFEIVQLAQFEAIESSHVNENDVNLIKKQS